MKSQVCYNRYLCNRYPVQFSALPWTNPQTQMYSCVGFVVHSSICLKLELKCDMIWLRSLIWEATETLWRVSSPKCGQCGILNMYIQGSGSWDLLWKKSVTPYSAVLGRRAQWCLDCTSGIYHSHRGLEKAKTPSPSNDPWSTTAHSGNPGMDAVDKGWTYLTYQ